MINTSINLADNPNVQEMFSILKENGKDTAGLTALLSYVNQMEGFVKSAESHIESMKAQIDEISEIQKHPIKAVLNDTSKSIKESTEATKSNISKLKESIITACKQAVTAFKENGTIALDKLADFFHVKQGLQAIQKDMTASMKRCDFAVAKIEVFSKEYHKAGRAIKNMANVAMGKDPVDTEKKMGALAKALCEPYKSEKKALSNIRNTAKKAIANLDDLSKNADKLRLNRDGQKKPRTDDLLAGYEAKANELNRDKVIQAPEFSAKSAIVGAEL